MSPVDTAVSICIVTHNSAAEIETCLTAIGRLRYQPLDLILVDCASRDRTLQITRDVLPSHLSTQIIELETNLGFAGGMNRAVAASASPFVLALNPDTIPEPEFLEQLMSRAQSSAALRPAAVTGRLLRPHNASPARMIDACGMRLVPTWRHLDRGSGELDGGQWLEPQRVFGATAAAVLYSREALDDIALGEEIFPAEFHSYREDAEICFRFRERQWEVLYEPTAVCTHSRRNLPSRRSAMTAEINYHSLKNRYLLRAYHQDLQNFVLTLIPTLWRDLLAFIWVLTAERSSLRAYSWLWRNRKFILQRRRQIRERKTCQTRDLNRWFFHESRPL